MFYFLFFLFFYEFDKSIDLYKHAGIDYSTSAAEINNLLNNFSFNDFYSQIDENLYNTTFEALKILNNTYLRRIYDLYGYKGLSNPHMYEGKQKDVLKITRIVPIYDFYKGCHYTFNFTRTRICRCPNSDPDNFKPSFMCSLCHGSTTILETITVEVSLKKGAADPFVFTFVNMSDATQDYSPSNIKLILKSEPTPFYSRRVNNIYVFALEPYSALYPGCQLSYYFIDD